MNKQEMQEQMFGMIEACNASGLTRKDFCTKNNINRPRFYYWAKKYNEHQMAQNGFIQIETKQAVVKSTVIEIVFPNGVKIVANVSTTINDLNKLINCW